MRKKFIERVNWKGEKVKINKYAAADRVESRREVERGEKEKEKEAGNICGKGEWEMRGILPPSSRGNNYLHLLSAIRHYIRPLQ